MSVWWLLVHLFASSPGISPSSGLPVLPLSIRSETLWVEIASTPAERMVGLMFRDSLPENHGMLFIFDTPQILKFWMKNTLIPLDIAFIDEAGVIIDIQAMEPLDTTLHVSPKAVPYALEVNRGWFKRHGIGVGDTLRGPAFPR